MPDTGSGSSFSGEEEAEHSPESSFLISDPARSPRFLFLMARGAAVQPSHVMGSHSGRSGAQGSCEWRPDNSAPRGDMDSFMAAAIAEAEAGLAEGGIPIGSVLVHQGKIVGRGHNRRVQKGSAILHGEMDALENGGRLPAAVYTRSVLYTTLSPCAMCSGAILLYRIPRVIVGENATYMGEEELLRNRGVTVEVLQDPRCIEMMRNFIREHPSLWNEDIGV